MKAKELRSKGSEELGKELAELLRAHFSLRMQIATQQLNSTSRSGSLEDPGARGCGRPAGMSTLHAAYTRGCSSVGAGSATTRVGGKGSI